MFFFLPLFWFGFGSDELLVGKFSSVGKINVLCICV